MVAAGDAEENRQRISHQRLVETGGLLAAVGGESCDPATLLDHGTADRVAALASRIESTTGRRKPEGTSRVGWQGVRAIAGATDQGSGWIHPEGTPSAAGWRAERLDYKIVFPSRRLRYTSLVEDAKM